MSKKILDGYEIGTIPRGGLHVAGPSQPWVFMNSMKNSLIVAAGDSITSGVTYDMSDYPRWLRFSIGRPVTNKGVGGNSVADLVARLQSDVINLAPGICPILIGTNNLGGSDSLITDAWESITWDLLDAGVYPLWCTITPRSDLPAHKAQIVRLRSWLINYAHRMNLRVADTWLALSDGNGDPASGMLTDGLHPSTYGSIILSDTIQAAIPSFAPAAAELTFPPASNIIANGDFSAHAAGVPTGWFFSDAGCGVPTIAAHPVSGNWWIITKSATGSAASPFGIYTLSGLTQGAHYRLACDFELAETGGAHGHVAYMTYTGDAQIDYLALTPKIGAISRTQFWMDFTPPNADITYLSIFLPNATNASVLKIGRVMLYEIP